MLAAAVRGQGRTVPPVRRLLRGRLAGVRPGRRAVLAPACPRSTSATATSTAARSRRGGAATSSTTGATGTWRSKPSPGAAPACRRRRRPGGASSCGCARSPTTRPPAWSRRGVECA